MNIAIAEILRGYIEDASFKDKLSGLVHTVKVGETDSEGKRVEKTYPVSCTYTYDECKKGKYAELVPNSKHKSIMYFEDLGISYGDRDGKYLNLESRLKLVCWANLTKMDKQDYSSYNMIAEILQLLPEYPFNSGFYFGVDIKVVSQDIRNDSIFSKYTYNHAFTQYLFYPYDYFAITFSVKYKINPACYELDPDCTDCP